MMRRRFLALATLTAVAANAWLASAAHARSAATIDEPAPAWTGKAADGSTIDLQSFRGKTVVLEWTNHDCPFVRKHYGSGNMQAHQKDAAAKGVIWLQVISSAPGKQGHVDGATAIRLNADRGATVTNTVLDPEGTIGRLYGAQTSPHMFIINAAGTLVYKGGIDSIPSSKQEDIAKAQPYVRDALAAVLAGKKVEQAVTKPYGCPVKYGD